MLVELGGGCPTGLMVDMWWIYDRNTAKYNRISPDFNLFPICNTMCVVVTMIDMDRSHSFLTIDIIGLYFSQIAMITVLELSTTYAV